MMKTQIKDFIIESTVNINYFDDIVDSIQNNLDYFYNFFEIKSFSKKWDINIVDYETFKKENTILKPYIVGITSYDFNKITILNIEDQKLYTTHKDTTLDDTLRMINHEVVHAFTDELCSNIIPPVWFKEGLATNLSNQLYGYVDMSNISIEDMNDENFHSTDFNYNHANSMVKYLLDNYPKEEILKFISNPEYLYINGNEILLNTQRYYNKTK